MSILKGGTHWQSSLNLTDIERDNFCQYKNINNGIHQHDDGTYWWYDETQADEFGGFILFEDALESLIEYCKTL